MALSDHSPKMRLLQAHGDGEFDRMPGKTPNTIWYCSDQQRHDTIGALGNPHVHTPNFDRLTERGAAFTHAFCQSPICTPSRSNFLTGLYPSYLRNNRNGNATFPLNTRAGCYRGSSLMRDTTAASWGSCIFQGLTKDAKHAWKTDMDSLNTTTHR